LLLRVVEDSQMMSNKSLQATGATASALER